MGNISHGYSNSSTLYEIMIRTMVNIVESLHLKSLTKLIETNVQVTMEGDVLLVTDIYIYRKI